MKTRKIYNYCEGVRKLLQPGCGRHYNVWIKKITGINNYRQDGFAFQGEFLHVRNQLTENVIDPAFPYLFYGQYDGASGPEIYACLAVVGPDGKFQVSGSVVTGRDYALKLRKEAESLLISLSGFCAEEFVSKLTEMQKITLRNHLNATFGHMVS